MTCPFKLVLVAFGIVTFFPLALVVITSLKSNTQFYHNFWLPELPFQFGNYSSAFRVIWRFIVNSVIYSGSTICLIADDRIGRRLRLRPFPLPIQDGALPRLHHA